MLDIVHKRYEDMQWGEKGFFTCTGKKDEENKEKEKKRFLQQDKKITVIVKKKRNLSNNIERTNNLSWQDWVQNFLQNTTRIVLRFLKNIKTHSVREGLNGVKFKTDIEELNMMFQKFQDIIYNILLFLHVYGHA